MDLTVEAQALKDLLKPGQNIIILLPESASRDAIAAGLGFSLSLQQAEHSVKIACPKPPTVGLSHLVGINKLVQQLGSKNFIISLDYIDGSIEKVSYNIEGNKFNLVIEPRPGAAMFNKDNVTYTQGGLVADLIIVISALTLESLGKTYTDNQNLFTEKPVLNIDNNPNNKQFGKINLVRPAASTSELVTQLIKSAGLPMQSDIATNLYDGVVSGSRNFSLPIVSADTFEAAAYLLRNGARKQMPPPLMQEELPQRELAGNKGPEEQQLPPDWFKPKIYKGGSTLL